MRLGYMVVTPEVERFPFAWVGPADEVLPAIADLSTGSATAARQSIELLHAILEWSVPR